MSRQPLPPGYRDTQTAAAELGLSNKQLLKKMRDIDWLINAPKTKRHNMPRREMEIRGFLTTQDRRYRPDKTKDMVRLYRITIISETGFDYLKSIINQGEISTTEAPTTVIESAASRAIEEHDKCLENMRKWGLAS